MKTVFSNAMCAHVWAQQNQEHGRSDNMRFDGPTLYSYSTPIARVVKAANGQSVALFTSRTYSVTTSGKHQGPAMQAWSGEYFVVPELGTHESDHTKNQNYLIAQYEKERARLMRCPADSSNLENYRIESVLRDRAHALLKYSDAFKLRGPTLTWLDDAKAIKARRDRLLADPKRAAKQEAARVAREKREAEKQRIAQLAYSEKLELWRAGASVYLPFQYNRDAGAALRIRGDRVETSWGAECPLADAKRALDFWRAIMANKGSHDFSNLSPGSLARIKLGQFSMDRIDANGTVTAGCHTFKRAELERFAALVG